MTHAHEKEWLTVPLSIVIAGALIGLGIYLGAREIKGSSSGSTALQQNPEKAAVAKAGDLSGKIAPVSAKDHIRGDLRAKAVVVEYSDTECPYCKRHHETLKKLVDESKGEVAWVYRHFPLDQLHSKARKEAEATECAAELGGNDGFWKYTDRLYEVTSSNNRLDPEQLPVIAEYAGIDRSKFESCLQSGRFAAKVDEQAKDAAAAGGRGTPFNVIVTSKGNTAVSGALPLEQLKQSIQTALAK